MAGKPVLTDAHLRILYYIVDEKGSFYNRLKERAHEEEGISNATVVTALKRLQEAGLIQLAQNEAEPKSRGRTRKIYDPTLKGLALSMRGNIDLWHKIDSIAEAQEKLLPLVFGKWGLYRETQMFRDQSNFENYINAVRSSYDLLAVDPTNNLCTILTLKLYDIFNSDLIDHVDGPLLQDLITYLVVMTLDKPWRNPDVCLRPFTLYHMNEGFEQVQQLWTRAAFGDSPREVILMTVASRDPELKGYVDDTLAALKAYYAQMQENLAKSERLWNGVLRIIR